jgi:hypothetical protein
MTMQFTAETATASESVVESVFARPVALRNEATDEAKPIPAGVIGLIANYRAFNTSGKGKKARGAGQAVLDLSAVSRLPASELGDLITKLRELQDSLDTGIEQAERLA